MVCLVCAIKLSFVFRKGASKVCYVVDVCEFVECCALLCCFYAVAYLFKLLRGLV